MDWTAYLRAMAARGRKSPFLRESAAFGSSTALAQASRLLTNLVAAAVLGPVVWGAWFLLNLVLRYGSLVHLGVVNGMSREVPAAMGRGDPAGAKRIQSATLGFVLMSYVVAALALVVIQELAGATFGAPEFIQTLVLLAAQQLFGFAMTLYKATSRFHLVSQFQVVLAVAFPLCVVPATVLWGLSGFIIGQTATFGLLTVLAHRVDRSTYITKLDWQTPRALIRIGFPIMLVGVTHALLTTTDRWIVAGMLGSEALGHYSLAIMAVGTVQMIPQVFSQQVYPRMAHAWSARRDAIELRRLAQRQSRLALAAVSATIIPVALVAPFAIPVALPDYTPGIAALLVSFAAPLVAVAGQGYGNILNVIDRQGLYLGLMAGALSVNLAASLILVRPLGLVGVAIGTVLGVAFLSLGLLSAGARALRTVAVRNTMEPRGIVPDRDGE